MASEHLGNVIEQFFPHPRRFRLVWTHQQGDKPLYTWRAVPPGPPGRSLFVAMGMVVTTTEDEPDLTSIRCMPKAWVQESPVPPRKIWDDSGPLSARCICRLHTLTLSWCLNCRAGRTTWVNVGCESARQRGCHGGARASCWPVLGHCAYRGQPPCAALLWSSALRSRPCLQYKFDEHSDLRKSNEPSPRAREPRKGLGDVPGQVAGWLDWKDRNRQGQTHQSRYYVVLQRDSKSLALFEREPPRNAPPGRPMAEVSLVPAPARTRLPAHSLPWKRAKQLSGAACLHAAGIPS